MKVTIEIPKEFIGDLESDRFEDFFERALQDMNGDGYGGNYERETALYSMNLPGMGMLIQGSFLHIKGYCSQSLFQTCSRQYYLQCLNFSQCLTIV